MKIDYFILGIAISLFAENSFAQETLSHHAVFPGGITAEYGLGQYAVRDEFVSKERYSGTVPYFSAKWSRFHDKWGYQMGLEQHYATDIRNNNVSAEVVQAALYGDFIYPVGTKSLLGNDVLLFLGPSTGFDIYVNNQNIASQNFLNADESEAVLFYLGANAKAIMPLRSNFQVECSVRTSLVSIGIRSDDPVEGKGSLGGVLNPLSGANPKVDFGIRYNILNKLSLKAAYKLHILRISKWDPLISVSDNITLSINYHL